ncbi:hypothetical protein [Amycolatopsis orientalis]|uniref:hypothetical protein n=1 Tax=Amycolatopsis orientalis TaxID=31958 RepID=UPI001319D99C|nr:hypothetical protein [Amycolatopsis orientalis]
MEHHLPAQERRTALLRDAGFVVVAANYSFNGPSPEAAWRPVISGDAVPTVRVSHESASADHEREVDRSWESVAEEFGVFGEGGDFLISVAGEGMGSLPWAHVRRGRNLSPARHLVDYPGEPEFVTMSMDGRAVCGVTTEEYDIWIIGATLA